MPTNTTGISRKKKKAPTTLRRVLYGYTATGSLEHIAQTRDPKWGTTSWCGVSIEDKLHIKPVLGVCQKCYRRWTATFGEPPNKPTRKQVVERSQKNGKTSASLELLRYGLTITGNQAHIRRPGDSPKAGPKSWCGKSLIGRLRTSPAMFRDKPKLCTRCTSGHTKFITPKPPKERKRKLTQSERASWWAVKDEDGFIFYRTLDPIDAQAIARRHPGSTREEVPFHEYPAAATA